MRRLGQLVGAAAVLAACVACGQQEEIGFGGTPPSATSVSASEPDEQPTLLPPGAGAGLGLEPPAGTTAVDQAKIDASALPEGYPDVVWTGDASTVGAYVQAGGCVQASAEAGEQAADKVVLKLVETHSGAEMCTMDIQFPPVEVKLDAPLGDRTVVLERVQVGFPG